MALRWNHENLAVLSSLRMRPLVEVSAIAGFCPKLRTTVPLLASRGVLGAAGRRVRAPLPLECPLPSVHVPKGLSLGRSGSKFYLACVKRLSESS